MSGRSSPVSPPGHLRPTRTLSNEQRDRARKRWKKVGRTLKAVNAFKKAGAKKQQRESKQARRSPHSMLRDRELEAARRPGSAESGRVRRTSSLRRSSSARNLREAKASPRPRSPIVKAPVRTNGPKTPSPKSPKLPLNPSSHPNVDSLADGAPVPRRIRSPLALPADEKSYQPASKESKKGGRGGKKKPSPKGEADKSKVRRSLSGRWKETVIIPQACIPRWVGCTIRGWAVEGGDWRARGGQTSAPRRAAFTFVLAEEPMLRTSVVHRAGAVDQVLRDG